MGAVWLASVSEVRRRWRSLVVLGLLAGLILGSVTWRAIAVANHLPADATVPLAWLSLVAVTAWSLSALLDISPARRAATLPPSALRTE